MDTECCQPIYDTLAGHLPVFCMAVPFAGSQANTQQIEYISSSSMEVLFSTDSAHALDSWVDRRKVVLHLDKCCEFRPVCRGGGGGGGGGGGQGPLMGEEVRLWVNGSAYRSLNMIWVCVQYTFSILYVHNAQDWGARAPLCPFPLCLWLMVLMVCPSFS